MGSSHTPVNMNRKSRNDLKDLLNTLLCLSLFATPNIPPGENFSVLADLHGGLEKIALKSFRVNM